MQVYVRELSGRTSVYDVRESTTVRSLCDDVYHRSFGQCQWRTPSTAIHLVTSQGKWISNHIYDSDDSCGGLNDSIADNSTRLIELGVTDESVLHVQLLIRGGKGGFGTALRTKAKQKGKHDLTDFSACRDLSGRRLRQVNDEQILQRWGRSQEAGAAYDPLQGSTSGIENWFLSTPSWLDVKKKSTHNRAIKEKEKTAICQDWQQARANRRDGCAPSGAPPWWGCPRGSRCKFAHGEQELQGHARHALHAAEKHTADEKLREGAEAYTDKMTHSYLAESAVLSMVQQGLSKRPKKRSRGESESEQGVASTSSAVGSNRGRAAYTYTDTDTNSDTGANGDAAGEERGHELHFPVTCVNGDVDITVDGATMQALQAGEMLNTQAVYTLEGISSFGTAIVTGCAIGPPPGGVSSSLRAAPHTTQSWSFEVLLKTNGLMQLGWAHSLFLAPSTGAGSGSVKSVGDGVGDDIYSWAWDGSRSQALHGDTSVAFPPSVPAPAANEHSHWQVGDVVKSTLTMNLLTGTVDISYAVNGVSIGTPFKRINSADLQSHFCAAYANYDGDGESESVNDAGFFPAFSLEAEECLELYLTAAAAPAPVPAPATDNVTTGSYSIAQYMEGMADAQEGVGMCVDVDASANSLSSPGTCVASASASAPTLAHVPPNPTPLHLASSASDFEETWSLESLKAELASRGVKAGGTLAERAARLFLVKDLKDEEIDPKLLARAKK